MDSFTASANPGNLTVETKPSAHFRGLFLLLLLLTLVTAAILTYVLVSKQSQPAVVSETQNPFNNEADATNPFVAETEAVSAVNPFAGETDTDNPFAQFETGSTSPTNQGEYQNPF